MIKTRNWVTALIFAVAIHAMAFAAFNSTKEDGAHQSGGQGVMVDLGMIGDLADAEQSEPEPVPTPVSKPEPTPEPVPQPKPEPTPAPKPEPTQEPVPAKQTTETVVKKQAEQTKVTQAPQEKTPIQKPEPANVVTAEPQTAKTTTNTEKSVQKKKTTGKANAKTNGGQPAARQSYFQLLAAKLAKNKRYPVISRRNGEEGIAKLFFIVDRNGKVLDYRITESSGSKRLDEAVIKMLKKAEPLPAFPDEMVQSQLEVNVPIAFQLNH